MAKLTFYGGTKIVTGACYLLEANNKKVIVDCGMFQGSWFTEEKNYEPFPFNPKQIDAFFLTHAHIDHCGRAAKLYRDGFRGKFYATAPTLDFSRIMLADSHHVMLEDSEKRGLQPFYGLNDIAGLMDLAVPLKYGERVDVAGGFSCRVRNSGHILGSAFYEFFVEENSLSADGRARKNKIVFSGDLGNPPTPLIKPIEYIDEADYLVIESAYGDRLHEHRDQRKEYLEDAIEETVKSGGVLMIPAFAMERTQELLYELNDLVEHGRVPQIPIFIDSPLAIKATEVYRRYDDYYNKEATYVISSGDEIFKFPGLKFTETVEESKKINEVPAPKIIIAGSGMSTAGRILHHEKKYLSDPKNTLLIFGYQAKGSLGRRLLEGQTEVKIHGETIFVRAKIKSIEGYSAHADQDGLVKWVRPMRHTLKKVFIVQGEDEAALKLATVFKDKLTVDAVVPEYGQEFILE